MKADMMQSFIFKNRAVRGSFVCLSKSYQTIINQHHYPEMLGLLLGEALLGISLMFPFFKVAGKITLQFQGEGSLNLLSARITSDLKIRGLLRASPELITVKNLQNALGEGQLSLRYEVDGERTYQSIVPFEQTSIAAVLEDYFMRSEQLRTRFYLFGDEQSMAGLILQALPDAEGYQDFEHCNILARTLQKSEMLNLNVQTLLQRLFAEEDIMIFPEKSIEFGCSCSHERMQNALVNLGQQEALSILEEFGFVEVTCEFCNQAHQFDQAEVVALFLGIHAEGLGQAGPGPHFNA